jgi:uncharacterized protein (TIGR04255 family)
MGVILNYNEKRYANPIIHEYLCRLDFTHNIQWTDNEIPQHLSNEAKKFGYGVVNVIPMNEETIQFGQKSVKRVRNQFNEWQFIGDCGNKFIISKSSIVHNVKKYDSYHSNNYLVSEFRNNRPQREFFRLKVSL